MDGGAVGLSGWLARASAAISIICVQSREVSVDSLLLNFGIESFIESGTLTGVLFGSCCLTDFIKECITGAHDGSRCNDKEELFGEGGFSRTGSVDN